MYYRFTSDITRLGPILTPYVLEIDDNFVRYSRRNRSLLNKDKSTMSIDQISNVRVNASLLGTDLIISGYGNDPIIIRRMNIQDAYAAEKIINNQREKLRL